MNKNISASKRIAWIDLLRVIACFMVVLSHSADAFVGQFDADRTAFLTGTALGSLMRPSVALFVMMTGALLLPLSDSTASLGAFYRRRVSRVVWPLVFWSIMLPVIGWFNYNYIYPDTSNPLLSTEMYTTETLIPQMWTWVFNFCYDSTALWYLYMLIGLYLAMPIINGWLATASRKDVKTVLIIWGVTLFLPYISMVAPGLGYQGNYGNFGILGVCDWNPYGTFYYFSGFIGYLLLAYYLKTYPLDWSRAKMTAILLPMFIIGYLITFWGYVTTNSLHPGNYAFLEVIWYFCGINVFMMTFPIFVVVSRYKGRVHRVVRALAPLTFGIYLVHFPFVAAGYELWSSSGLPDWCRIILGAVVVFAGTALIVKALYTFKPTRALVA